MSGAFDLGSIVLVDVFLFGWMAAPIGVWIAASAYPWRSPRLQPYLSQAALMSAPFIAICVLWQVVGRPYGSCVTRPINNAPYALDVVALVVAAGVCIFAGPTRRFAVGLAVAIVPATLTWSFLVSMGLSNCAD